MVLLVLRKSILSTPRFADAHDSELEKAYRKCQCNRDITRYSRKESRSKALQSRILNSTASIFLFSREHRFNTATLAAFRSEPVVWPCHEEVWSLRTSANMKINVCGFYVLVSSRCVLVSSPRDHMFFFKTTLKTCLQPAGEEVKEIFSDI